MTAVLLTILKIIGIVLLVILGIILFLLAVLLFVPVRYSVKGTVDNNITAEGKISWLCSIFRYDFTFQEQELNGEVRIFGFRPKKKERVSEEELLLPDEQHDDYRWLTPDALLASDNVHANSRAYFLAEKRAGVPGL